MTPEERVKLQYQKVKDSMVDTPQDALAQLKAMGGLGLDIIKYPQDKLYEAIAEQAQIQGTGEDGEVTGADLTKPLLQKYFQSFQPTAQYAEQDAERLSQPVGLATSLVVDPLNAGWLSKIGKAPEALSRTEKLLQKLSNMQSDETMKAVEQVGKEEKLRKLMNLKNERSALETRARNAPQQYQGFKPEEIANEAARDNQSALSAAVRLTENPKSIPLSDKGADKLVYDVGNGKVAKRYRKLGEGARLGQGPAFEEQIGHSALSRVGGDPNTQTMYFKNRAYQMQDKANVVDNTTSYPTQEGPVAADLGYRAGLYPTPDITDAEIAAGNVGRVNGDIKLLDIGDAPLLQNLTRDPALVQEALSKTTQLDKPKFHGIRKLFTK